MEKPELGIGWNMLDGGDAGGANGCKWTYGNEQKYRRKMLKENRRSMSFLSVCKAMVVEHKVNLATE